MNPVTCTKLLPSIAICRSLLQVCVNLAESCAAFLAGLANFENLII